jgi:hypothetical protein
MKERRPQFVRMNACREENPPPGRELPGLPKLPHRGCLQELLPRLQPMRWGRVYR